MLALMISVMLDLVMAISSTALAETMTLTKSADPIPHTYPDHALDVLGIAPGMPLEDAKAKIVAEYGTDPAETRSSISLQYRSIPVSTDDYVSELKAKKDSDSITVYFGPPSTGNVVVGVERQVQYPDARNAPLVDSVVHQLEGKYGVVSGSSNLAETTIVQTWYYNSNALQKCAVYGCPFPAPPLQVNALQNYIQNIANGQHIILNTQIIRDNNDKTRVGWLYVRMSDESNKAKALQEAFRQMEKAGLVFYNKTANPQQGPRL
jgi:hypothetical protein